MEFSELFILLKDASAWVIPVLLAVTLHEAAHGYAALRFGDTTARDMGRISVNPIRHVDPVGTVLIPGLLLFFRAPFVFGYAKPVPVDFRRLRPFRFGSFMVAFAGPGTNIILALISAALLHLESWITPEQAPWLYLNLYRSIIINCALAVFNMLPLLPLDGGRVLRALLPEALARQYDRTEQYGMMVVIGLIFLVPWLTNVDLVGNYLGTVNGWMIEQVLHFTGNGGRISH